MSSPSTTAAAEAEAAAAPSAAAAAASLRKKEQPSWAQPAANAPDPLLLNNSLTCSKVQFCPIRCGVVAWYACGPTVYDSAHLGHARAYVTFDILRRILQDYFAYNIFYVMNITDIDDKIILRARREHLFRQYAASGADVETVKQDAVAAFREQELKHQSKVSRLRKLVEEAEASHRRDEMVSQVDMQNKKHEKLLESKQEFEMLLHSHGSKEEILSAVKDVISEYLDSKQGADVTDQSIFRDHAAKFEAEFLEDMARLHVREPDVLTRVSEYVDQIIVFVQEIIAKGFAYESNGSVYFDVASFSSSPDCNYAKLSPWSVGNEALNAEGEGALASSGSEKRNANDFALWKLSKAGEPSWDSPWGPGRPGWHIECSAMASDLLGSNFDIHSGGEDLKFPHHDNELAQSEARFGCKQWVNYFLHAGHLHIEGMKMSKSLKNFITIREALEIYTPRQIRILFLLQGWDKPMNFSPQSLDAAVSKEARLKAFFLSVSVCLRRGLSGSQVWSAAETALHNQLLETQGLVDRALRDNFDYPLVMSLIFDLLTEANKYLAHDEEKAQPLLLKKIATWFTRMLKIFGVLGDDEMGFQQESSGLNREAILTPVLDCVTAFRDKVRAVARSGEPSNALLPLCDQFRDGDMPELGVRVEDKGAKSVWKLDDPEAMKQERFEKLREAEMRAIQKMESKLKAKTGDLERLKSVLRDPSILFVSDPPKYSEFGEDHIPIRNADGSEVSVKVSKKLKKTMEKFLANREKAMQQVQEDPNLVSNLQAEVEAITQQLHEMRIEAGFDT